MPRPSEQPQLSAKRRQIRLATLTLVLYVRYLSDFDPELRAKRGPRVSFARHSWLMDISPWQRVRLDPSAPVWRREDGTLVVGHSDAAESAPVAAPSDHPDISALIQLLDGEHSTAELVQSGLAMGMPAPTTHQFLNALADAGHIYRTEAVSTPRIAMSSMRDLQHFARVRAVSAETLLSLRESTRVLVVGDGLVSAALAASATHAGLRVGWQSDSNRRVRLEDCSLPWLNPDTRGVRWRDLGQPLSAPDYVLVVDQTPAARELATEFAHAVVLPITAHPRRLAVGPLLNLKEGICSECIDSSRSAADPDWAYRLAQLKQRTLSPPLIADSFINAFVGTTLNFLLELVDTGRASSLHEQSWELAPPNPQWRTRRWSRQPECVCNDFQQERPQS